MPILDATPGGANSNSYGTISEAASYFSATFATARWAAVPDQVLALIVATSQLERHRWVGTRATSTQALRWPRWGVPYEDAGPYALFYPNDTVPLPIKQGQFELALYLSENPDQDETGLDGFKSIQLSRDVKFEIQPLGKSPKSLPSTVLLILNWFLLGQQATLIRA